MNYPVTFNNSTESEIESVTFSIKDNIGNVVQVQNKSSNIFPNEEATIVFEKAQDNSTYFFKKYDKLDSKRIEKSLKENPALQRQKTVTKKIDRDLLEVMGRRVISVSKGVTKFTEEYHTIDVPETDGTKIESGLKMLGNTGD